MNVAMGRKGFAMEMFHLGIRASGHHAFQNPQTPVIGLITLAGKGSSLKALSIILKSVSCLT